MDTIYANKKLCKSYTTEHPNSKHTLNAILCDILYVLRTGIAWRDLRSNINWKTVYWHFSRFIRYDIFKKAYNRLRTKLSSSNNSSVYIVDSTFIMNKFGRNKIAKNKFFRSKNCNKLSLVIDEDGFPLSVLLKPGNVHDLSFMNEHIRDMICFRRQPQKNITLLADKAYESKALRQKLSTKEFQLMVPKKKGAVVQYPFDKTVYRNRIIVEHTIQKLKVYRRISVRYDAKIKSIRGFIYLALCQLYSYS